MATSLNLSTIKSERVVCASLNGAQYLSAKAKPMLSAAHSMDARENQDKEHNLLDTSAWAMSYHVEQTCGKRYSRSKSGLDSALASILPMGSWFSGLDLCAIMLLRAGGVTRYSVASVCNWGRDADTSRLHPLSEGL